MPMPVSNCGRGEPVGERVFPNRVGVFARFALGIVASCVLATPALPQSLGEILERVTGDVDQFRRLLPNLVCNETTRSQRAREERRTRTAVTFISERGTQAWEEPSGPPFVVSRETGPPESGTFRRIGPGFGSVVTLTFLPENLPFHEYSLGPGSPEGEPIRLSFRTRDGQSELRFLASGESYPFIDTGTAWIDPATFEILRIDRVYMNHPDYEELSVSVEYGEVALAGPPVWMPRRLRVEALGEVREVHTVDYGECRRFGTSVNLNTGG